MKTIFDKVAFIRMRQELGLVTALEIAQLHNVPLFIAMAWLKSA